ncbi:MAG: Npt1/Npt2 family nucleotide transporter [Thermodesulfobacteriota bacterium]|nr:Npt1/Npt2 family nucleotide transporter [Thermodesulfobacteriota bacterium]
MTKLLGRWLNIYKNEISLFLWTAALLFLVRGCGVYLNNYAETTFLKRYGVEYMPIVNMLNAVATFLIMAAMTGMITRLPGARLLTRLFVFCGVSVAAIRLIIPLGYDLVYPLLFMLKSQYEILIALVFWNLANDLFNTRQSKRLFPLITAGGILGQMLGSFSTPFIVKAISIDNLLFVYLVITLMGAVVVRQMGRRFPALLFSSKTPSKISSKTPSRNDMIGEIKKIIPLIKSSPLINLMILMTLLPNVVIPIMNYQFNFAVNDQFGSETAMIQFFAYFRGVLSIVSLFLLLFVGRIYGRWGLPVALMFHPFNYMLVFIAFLLRFDAVTAVYARMSSNIIRSAINIPAMAVIYGLFPKSYRNLVRPFLRGTVVRIALFLGSGLILLSTNLFHPRYLSLVALPFVAGWLITTFVLKKRYARILLDLISQDMDTFDMKSFESKEIQQLFNDKAIRDHFMQTFSSSSGEDCLWYARLMRSLNPPDLDAHILEKLEKETDPLTRIGLLDLLSPSVDKAAGDVFDRLAVSASGELNIALVRTAGRISPDIFSDFIKHQLATSAYPEARGYAVAALFDKDPDKYQTIIQDWLESDKNTERLAGVIAAGRTDRDTYIDWLKTVLTGEQDENIVVEILTGLRRLNASDLNDLLLPFLKHKNTSVRLAALEAFDINDDDSLRRIINLLKDTSDEIVNNVKDKIINADYHHDQLLVESLTLPKRKIREGLFDLIEKMELKEIDTVQFAREQIEKGYRHLAEAVAVDLLPVSPVQELLHRHLTEKHMLPIDNTLRVLSIMDSSGRIKTIHRGLNSADLNQRGNSVEALENLLKKPHAKILIPLVEDLDPTRRLAAGRKYFDLPEFHADPVRLVNYLVNQKDWVTTTLVHYILNHMTPEQIDKDALASMIPSNKQVTAGDTFSTAKNATDEEIKMADMMTLPDKIIQLRKVEIFKDLGISELAAIAAIVEEEVFSTGDIVIREGEMSQVLYLVIEGETSVIKNQDTDREIELARIKSNDYFGEMALMEEGRPRSATIRTEKPSRFLSLQKQELIEIINEYPKIAVNFCRVLTRRLRTLDEKASALECAPKMLA